MPTRIREVRGRGCMVGLVLNEDAAPVIPMLLANGVIANATAGNVIRFVPPFVIQRADVDELEHALRRVLTA